MLKVPVLVAVSVILITGCVEPQKIPKPAPPTIAKTQETKPETPRVSKKERCAEVEDSAMRDCINLKFDYMANHK